MSFFRHGEIYRSDMISKTINNWGPGAAARWSAPRPSQRTRRKGRALLIVRDEFPVGYSSAGCSPAEPASALPAGIHVESAGRNSQVPLVGGWGIFDRRRQNRQTAQRRRRSQ